MKNLKEIKSNDNIIIADDISKYYPLNPQLRRRANDTLFTYLNKVGSKKRGEKKFLALKNVSFKVSTGEIVGIIGSNGSGKSTLVRVLSGILEPTSGRVEVRGTAGELFSLNTGFNAMLSGRKNIYLYAAMKGIDKKEIEKKAEEIIEFSELGDFIDIPMNRYSSGMRGKLGFSLVFHTLPDIVFIDEAMSAGDARFRKKTEIKVKEIRDDNRTMVIVSHSMPTLISLCTRVIWLEKGKILRDGDVESVIEEYLKHNPNKGKKEKREKQGKQT